VRVNTIVVGPFATDVAEHWADAPDPTTRADQGRAALGQPDEIVGLGMYLASDASSFTNADHPHRRGPVRARRPPERAQIRDDRL